MVQINENFAIDSHCDQSDLVLVDQAQVYENREIGARVCDSRSQVMANLQVGDPINFNPEMEPVTLCYGDQSKKFTYADLLDGFGEGPYTVISGPYPDNSLKLVAVCKPGEPGYKAIPYPPEDSQMYIHSLFGNPATTRLNGRPIDEYLISAYQVPQA